MTPFRLCDGTLISDACFELRTEHDELSAANAVLNTLHAKLEEQGWLTLDDADRYCDALCVVLRA